MSVETEIALLKREVDDMKGIHARLDTAIEKIADVSSSLHTIMAVHEEKLIRQEEALDGQETEFKENIQELFFDQAHKKCVKASTIYLKFNKDFL